MANILFGYRLKEANKTTNVGSSMKAAAYGSASDQSRLYYLELYAQRAAGDSGGAMRLDGFDVQLGFNDTILASLNQQLQTTTDPATDSRPAAIDISSALPLFRNIQFGVVDGSGGNTVRFTAGSTASMQASGPTYTSTGTGVVLAAGEEKTLAHIKLDINDRWNLDRLVAAPSPAISDTSTKVNVDETVVTLVDSDKVQSLRDLRGKAADTSYDSLQAFDAAVSTTVERASQSLAAISPGSEYWDDAFGIRIATRRFTGLEQLEYTNLVRKGSSFSDAVRLENAGSSTLTSVKAFSTGVIENGTFTLQIMQRSSGSANWSDAVVMTDADSELALADVNYKFDSSGAVTELGQIWAIKNLVVTGEAGSVLRQDGAGGLDVRAYADGESQLGTVGTIHGTTSKNLITYKGDLNYDGRVSMKDLAFLNAGAKAWNNGSGVYTSELDADHDKAFNIGDLAVLDQDWGNSLHKTLTGGATVTDAAGAATTRSFTGNNAISWSELNSNGGYIWTNKSFEDQSKLEASSSFVATLDT